MPTKLKDESAGHRGEKWGGFGVGCILKGYYTGTVCFPIGGGLGTEFGCGIEKEVGVEKEESLELKIGGELGKKLGVDLTFGTKTTKSEKATIKAERCEWCRPELCFPDSRVEVWTCYGVWTLYRHGYDKTYFYPGSTSELTPNCREDRERCHCTNEHARLQIEPRVPITTSSLTRTGVVMTPTDLDRVDQVTPLNAVEAADAFSALYGDGLATPRFAGQSAVLGLATSDGPVNWLYPCDDATPTRLSLVSHRISDAAPEIGAALFAGRFLPVLVLGPRMTKAHAEVVATVEGQTGPPYRILGQAEVRTGLLTLIWQEFDLKDVQVGATVTVEVKLLPTDDSCRIGTLIQSYFKVA